MAYRSQLTEVRRRQHAALADELVRRHSARLDEKAALIAHHREQANEPLEAARWHSRAAWSSRDFAEAHRSWSQARSLLQGVPESTEREELELNA